MPAKLKLTYELVGQIVELKRDGLCDADIIAAIGVHPATFYRWLKEGENARAGVKRALYDELKKAESAYKRGLLTTIKSAAESRAQFWTAAAWLLERKYPMEYGRMDRKSEDSDSAPVQLTLGLVIEPMADDGEGDPNDGDPAEDDSDEGPSDGEGGGAYGD